jgi:hypothetical protein
VTAQSALPLLSAQAQERRSPPLRLAHTDWLFHHFDIEGSSDDLARFAAAAAGSGSIPWRLDLDLLEEDAFHTLVGASALSLQGAQVLAGQLRHAAGRRHRLAVDRVGNSRACPFDLHALAPVPDDVLFLGPDHPDALAWLWTSWGTTDALRHVTRRLASTETRLSIAFWSADWTPWRALETLRVDWPDLGFTVRPLYGRD